MEVSARTFIGIMTGIFVILFVVTTATAFALVSVEGSVFDASLYVQALDEENVYQQLPALTAQALASVAQQPGRPSPLSVFRNLSTDEWRTLVMELLPPDLMRALTDDVVVQIMAYLNGERNNAVLDLTALNAHLQSPEGVAAVYRMLKEQPDCTLDQLRAMALGQGGLTLCNPPETFLFVNLRPIVETEIRGALSLIPEQITLLSAGPNRLQALRDLNAIRLFMRLSPLVPATCLLLVTILAVRSLRGWLAWWGVAFLFAGLASIFLGALSGPMASLTFQVFIAPVIPGFLPAEIVGVFRGLTAAIIRHALGPVVLWAGIMSVVGLAMALLAYLLARRIGGDPVYYES
jgi:hypothetical protein